MLVSLGLNEEHSTPLNSYEWYPYMYGAHVILKQENIQQNLNFRRDIAAKYEISLHDAMWEWFLDIHANLNSKDFPWFVHILVPPTPTMHFLEQAQTGDQNTEKICIIQTN